jgi:GNAT superfamily N-acetyltransferase
MQPPSVSASNIEDATLMPTQITTRSARPEDKKSWLALWHAYCADLEGTVSDMATDGLWQRILSPDQPIWCLVACDGGGEPVGLAHYVLHLHTWSLHPVCYLEDLYVALTARGGAGRQLIEGLVSLGRNEGWRRIYWHTHENNYRARALYDRLTPRTDYIRYDIDL